MGDIEEMASLCQHSVIGDGVQIQGKFDKYKEVIGLWQDLNYYRCMIHGDEKLEPYDASANYGLYCNKCGITYMTHVGDPDLLKVPDENTPRAKLPEPKKEYVFTPKESE